MKKQILIQSACLVLTVILLLAGCRSQKTQQDSVIDTSSMQSVVLPSSSEQSISSEQSSTLQSSSQTVGSSKKPTSSASASSMSSSSKPVSSTPVVTEKTDEMRAMWFTYIELDSVLRNKTAQQFKASVDGWFDNCVKLGMNTVIVQVRSHADAIYPSQYYPTAVHFTNKRTNSAPFDALQIMIEAAHKRGLEFHAWVNPFRGHREAHALAENDPMKTYKNMTYLYDGIYYLDPAYPQVRELIVNGIKEIVTKYDVDGIHFDDRFYPVRDESIDQYSYTLYGNGRTRKQFRLDNVNTLIKEIYNTIKSIKNIPFGISPQGNVNNNYYTCFADVKLWSSTAGYVDYIAPQLYWSYGEGTLPFEKALPIWQEMVTCPQVKLIIGLAPYKVGVKPEWTAGNILAREIVDSRKSSQYAGFIMYRYDFYVADVCKTERQNVNTLLGVK